jgi:hypothetical protein
MHPHAHPDSAVIWPGMSDERALGVGSERYGFMRGPEHEEEGVAFRADLDTVVSAGRVANDRAMLGKQFVPAVRPQFASESRRGLDVRE